MPPETEQVTKETPTPPQNTTVNSPEARNSDGSLKDGLSGTPETPTKEDGETKSTPPSQSEKSLLNQDQKKPEADGEKKPEKPASIATGAPESYKFENLPEGFEVTDKALSFFKDNEMSQAQADKAIAFYTELAKEAAQAPFKYWQDMNDAWVKDVTADPEYKGDIRAVQTSISKFIDGINDPALANSFREAMDLTGAGNHPAFVKYMFRMSQAFNEGSFVKPGGPSRFGQLAPGKSERPDAAHAMYPGLK